MRRATRAAAKAAASSKGLPPPPRVVPHLTAEITDFSSQLAETDAEIRNREATVARCERVLNKIVPGANIHVFGSCVTGLRLPQGDVDLMVELPKGSRMNQKKLLFKLADGLRQGRIARKIVPLPWARVPILKWTDAKTRVNVDVCVDNIDGLKTTALIARSAVAHPPLRPLALILKSQLLLHDFGETRTGGIGGYLLVNMLRHLLLTRPPPAQEKLLRYEPRGSKRMEIAKSIDGIAADAVTEQAEAEAQEDLGGLLLRFYWFYGYALDTRHSVILKEHDSTIARGPEHHPGYLLHANDKLSLSDPAAPWVDLGAKAFNFESVRRLLRLTYMQLLQRIEIVNTRPEERNVPKWQQAKWEAQQRDGGDVEQAAEIRKKKGGAKAKAVKEAEAAEPSILSAVLPKWRSVWDERDARKQQRKRKMHAAMRKEEESKMEHAATLALQEMESGTSQSRDPLWSAGVS